MQDPECQRLIKNKNEIDQLKQDIRTYENKIKELNEQNRREKEETNKTKEDLEGKIVQFEKEIIQLKKEIEKLKNIVKENEESHQREMQALKDGYKDDLSKFEDRYTKSVEELCKSHKKKIKELEDYRTAYEMNEDENRKLREEKNERKATSKDLKKLTNDKHKLCLGQLCLELQTNLYCHVMPKSCCAKDCFYKIKDIQNDINDLLKGKEKEEADERLGELKEKINWKELEQLVGTMKQLQYQRRLVAHPDDVDEDGATRAAKELDKSGQLKGQTSIERVNIIIKIWSFSKKLPKSI